MPTLKQLNDRICRDLPVKTEKWFDACKWRLDIEYRGRYVGYIMTFNGMPRMYASHFPYGCQMTSSDIIQYIRVKMREIDSKLP